MMLILTVVLWGIAPIFDKAGLQGTSPFVGAIFRNASVGVIMIAVALFSGKTKEIVSMDGRSMTYFILSSICAGALGVFTYYKALQSAPTSKIVPLASTYPLITALLSVAFLGESVTLTRFFGIILIICGILLVK